MKKIIFFALILLSCQVFCQQMVNVDILAFMNQVPAPPADVNEAFSRMNCTGESSMRRCDIDAFYQPIIAKLSPVRTQIEQLNIALAMPSASGMQAMDPAEIQKKLAAMTLEEQMAFAMQMSTPGAMVPESDAVNEALALNSELGANIGLAMSNPDGVVQKRVRLIMDRDAKHSEINNWAASEIQKLPLISFGEAGRGHDPAAVYAIQVAAMDKHIALENAYLQSLQSFWQECNSEYLHRYSPFAQQLAAIDYGNDAANQETKRILVGGQSMLFGPVDDLITFSRDVTESAGNWWQQKLDLDQQNPNN